jgi:hypothetical protein
MSDPNHGSDREANQELIEIPRDRSEKIPRDRSEARLLESPRVLREEQEVAGTGDEI